LTSWALLLSTLRDHRFDGIDWEAADAQLVLCQMRRTRLRHFRQSAPLTRPTNQLMAEKIGREVFKPKNWLDRVFEIGIIGKGLNGAAERSADCCCCC
jgi:hypothetical protein